MSWFQNAASNVSTHYVVRSSDGDVTQMLHEADNGWHAGNSTYNRQSIGIEHEGFVDDPERWYTDAMYASSAELVRYLCDKYEIPIDRDHIIGHVEVPGASHTDPGPGWDGARFMTLVRGEPERPAYEATLGATDHPETMTAGERAVAWVEYQNDGAATWRLDRTRLGTSSPEDHDSPFYDVENWLDAHRSTPPDHGDYGTGRTGRFTFMITAPEVDGEQIVTDTFRLVEEGVGWFGDDFTLSVRVRPRTDESDPDDDEDGFSAATDCDEGDASVHPGATELCGDGVDQDCDGEDLRCGSEGSDVPDAEIPDSGSADSGSADSGSADSGSADSGLEPDAPGERAGPMDPTLSGGCSVSPRRSQGHAWLASLALGLLIVRRRR